MASWFNPSKGTGPIPIVQGRPVMAPASIYDQSTGYGNYYQQDDVKQVTQHNASPYSPGNVSSYKPEIQPRKCRDAIWGVLFYVHLFVMIIVTAIYAPQAVDSAVNNYAQNSGQRRLIMSSISRFLDEDNNEYNGNGGGGYDQQENGSTVDIDPKALLSILGIAGVFGFILSSCSMALMIKFAEPLVKIALFFNIGVFAAVAVLSLLSGSIMGFLLAAVMSVCAAWYAYAVWERIPFAASNLVTSVTAVRANIGLALYAYLSLVLVFGWSIWWTVGTVSTILVLSDCDQEGVCQNEISLGILFLFFISFYWTIQVIVNVVHVTTAGTVGTWWFTPAEANGCFSEAVRSSYLRSLTSSFGSICLGSLIVALIQATKEIVHSMRENGDQMLLCIAECVLGCIESMTEYFNKWAYVYVGLYGFSFMEAGSNVMTLFRNRGWTTIITDSMVDTVLFMVAGGVGAITALLAVLIGATLSLGSSATLGTAALLGFFIGYSMSATLFSIISSAVNTVIVCYAEAPSEFQANHPELSNRMRDSWRQAWPNDFNY